MVRMMKNEIKITVSSESPISEELSIVHTPDVSEFLDCREDMPCYNELFCECRDCDECSFNDTI